MNAIHNEVPPAVSDSLFAAFKARADFASAEVHRFATRMEALEFILQFLVDAGIADAPQAYAIWAECPFLDGIEKRELSARVPGLRFDVSAAVAADSKIGISQMQWGIATSGTLVQDATRVDKRLVSSLPVIHIALAPTSGILPDLAAAVAVLDPRRSAYISCITGPSRTADIERVLTIGVHGPDRLIVVFVDELAVEVVA